MAAPKPFSDYHDALKEMATERLARFPCVVVAHCSLQQHAAGVTSLRGRSAWLVCRATEVLKDQLYQHTQIKTWIRTICDNILEEVWSTSGVLCRLPRSHRTHQRSTAHHTAFLTLAGSQGDWEVVQDLREHRAYAK
jgi:hypothetical protein